MRAGTGCLLALAALFALGLSACESMRAPPTADEAALQAAVEALLDQHPELRPPSLVYVRVRGHVVMLSGTVTSDYARRLAESAAREAAGVAEVSNFIGIENSSR